MHSNNSTHCDFGFKNIKFQIYSEKLQHLKFYSNANVIFSSPDHFSALTLKMKIIYDLVKFPRTGFPWLK